MPQHARAPRFARRLRASRASGDEARRWLDTVYGTNLRLTGRSAGSSTTAPTTAPSPSTTSGSTRRSPSTPTRCRCWWWWTCCGGADRVRPRRRRRPGATTATRCSWPGGTCPSPAAATSPSCAPRRCSADGLMAAIEEADPDYPWQHIIFTSYVPHSPAAGARWRATVDQISSMLPDDATAEQAGGGRAASWATPCCTPSPTTSSYAPRCPGVDHDAADDSPSTVRRAARIIEAHALGGAQPRRPRARVRRHPARPAVRLPQAPGLHAAGLPATGPARPRPPLAARRHVAVGERRGRRPRLLQPGPLRLRLPAGLRREPGPDAAAIEQLIGRWFALRLLHWSGPVR